MLTTLSSNSHGKAIRKLFLQGKQGAAKQSLTLQERSSSTTRSTSPLSSLEKRELGKHERFRK